MSAMILRVLLGFVIAGFASVASTPVDAAPVAVASAMDVSIVSESVATAPVVTLAQYDDDSSSDSTRVSGRGMRGIVKLAIGAGIALLAVGKWLLGKVMGSHE